MKLRRALFLTALFGVGLAMAPSATGHRLDEYLQATLLAVDTDHVDLEINLTPGIALAAEVFDWIDTDRDRAISATEGEVYARQMLRSLTLSVDGVPAPVTLVDGRYPEFADMNLGVGTIRLRATAKIPATSRGFHQVTFLNTHKPESSVYLVNALVPSNPHIQLGAQSRDIAQHRLTLDYTVMSNARPAWSFPLIAGLGGLVLVGRLLLAGRLAFAKRSTITNYDPST